MRFEQKNYLLVWFECPEAGQRKAVMLEKYILINGMLHHGTKEEKARAKQELAELIPITNTRLEKIS